MGEKKIGDKSADGRGLCAGQEMICGPVPGLQREDMGRLLEWEFGLSLATAM